MRNFILVGAVLIGLSLAGCRSAAPLMNVTDSAVPGASGKRSEQVRAAIIRAGGSLGWQFKDESPTLLVGTLQLREHVAVIEIPYSSMSYSIKYRSSINLHEKNGTIHQNYNGWIQNLTKAINTQLSNS
jgi:hypothetical protein